MRGHARGGEEGGNDFDLIRCQQGSGWFCRPRRDAARGRDAGEVEPFEEEPLRERLVRLHRRPRGCLRERRVEAEEGHTRVLKDRLGAEAVRLGVEERGVDPVGNGRSDETLARREAQQRGKACTGRGRVAFGEHLAHAIECESRRDRGGEHLHPRGLEKRNGSTSFRARSPADPPSREPAIPERTRPVVLNHHLNLPSVHRLLESRMVVRAPWVAGVVLGLLLGDASSTTPAIAPTPPALVPSFLAFFLCAWMLGGEGVRDWGGWVRGRTGERGKEDDRPHINFVEPLARAPRPPTLCVQAQTRAMGSRCCRRVGTGTTGTFRSSRRTSTTLGASTPSSRRATRRTWRSS